MTDEAGWIEDEAVWNEELKTSVSSLSYDYSTRRGVIDMPPNCCTDMAGAIRLFTRIDDSARAIQTRSGGAADVKYVRKSKDVWKAEYSQQSVW